MEGIADIHGGGQRLENFKYLECNINMYMKIKKGITLKLKGALNFISLYVIF